MNVNALVKPKRDFQLMNPMESNASLATAAAQDGGQGHEVPAALLQLFTELIDGLYFDMLVELDSGAVPLSRKVDVVEQVYRRGQLFSGAQARTLTARVQLRLAHADYSQGGVSSVAGVRLALMLRQEAARGRHTYEPNPLMQEGCPVHYASCFGTLYGTATKRCRFILVLLEAVIGCEAVVLQALGNGLLPSLQEVLELERPVEHADATATLRGALSLLEGLCKNRHGVDAVAEAHGLLDYLIAVIPHANQVGSHDYIARCGAVLRCVLRQEQAYVAVAARHAHMGDVLGTRLARAGTAPEAVAECAAAFRNFVRKPEFAAKVDIVTVDYVVQAMRNSMAGNA